MGTGDSNYPTGKRPLTEERYAQLYLTEPLIIRTEFILAAESVLGGLFLQFLFEIDTEYGENIWWLMEALNCKERLRMTNDEIALGLTQLQCLGLVSVKQGADGAAEKVLLRRNLVMDAMAGYPEDPEDSDVGGA